ncbi:MAG: hypothetical protein IK125_07105 [Lachnospiraceae bacterium]|nr:hypothetical protein [Lachnospiraceae bacterium]
MRKSIFSNFYVRKIYLRSRGSAIVLLLLSVVFLIPTLGLFLMALLGASTPVWGTLSESVRPQSNEEARKELVEFCIFEMRLRVVVACLNLILGYCVFSRIDRMYATTYRECLLLMSGISAGVILLLLVQSLLKAKRRFAGESKTVSLSVGHRFAAHEKHRSENAILFLCELLLLVAIALTVAAETAFRIAAGVLAGVAFLILFYMVHVALNNWEYRDYSDYDPNREFMSL